MSSTKIKITSEIGRLEQVIIHRPGLEIEQMSPQATQDELFDDMISLSEARREHEQLSAALNQFADVYELSDLLTETLEHSQARHQIIEGLCQNYNCLHLLPDLLALSSAELAQKLIVGTAQQAITLAAFLADEPYALPPMYNFYFMRDAAMCVNDRVIIGAMANRTRWGESLIMKTIFSYHPYFAGVEFELDGSAIQKPELTIEGGDVMVLREDLVVIGQGERTSVAGIDALIPQLAASHTIRHLIVQQIPCKRAYIHFDMVFTMIDHDLCVIYEPVIQGNESRPSILFELQPNKAPRITRHPSLLKLLSDLGMPLTPIITGGASPLQQAREQWQKGTNFFTMAPGKIIGYARHERTYRELEQHGFRIVSGRDVAADKIDLTQSERIAVAMDGAELSRGGGGCRCMTLPIRRG